MVLSPYTRSGLKERTGRHQAGLQIAPQSHQELACHGHDGDATRPALEVTDAFPEPDAQGAAGLIAQPRPGELDHHAARRGIAGLADALVAIDRAAAKRARSQAHIAPQFPTIGKFSIEHLANESGGELRADRSELGKHFDLASITWVDAGFVRIAARSASTVAIISITNSRRLSSRTISALSRVGNARPSPV